MNETVGGKDRIEAAIRLELLDRVPVAPLVIYFCAHFYGITTKEFLNDAQKHAWALEQTFERLGGWDAWYPGGGGVSPRLRRFGTPLRQKEPGYGLPADAPLPQYDETEIMTVEDYDAIVEMGFPAWYASYYQRVYPGVDLQVIQAEDGPKAAENSRRFRQKWEIERSVPLLGGATALHPVDMFSMGRTFQRFSLDMARVPDKILAASDAMWEWSVQSTLGVKKNDMPIAWVGGWRTSASFISPRQYQKVGAPYLQRIVDALVSEGITPLLHFDGNWDPMLEFLRDLPPEKCILAVDQDTDLFKAKEILGDHTCLMGNVAPQTLALGTVDETVAETVKLIDVVGEGGGFILSSGCEVPYNAKPENVAAMIDTAKTHAAGR
jgi:hypothetical protein